MELMKPMNPMKPVKSVRNKPKEMTLEEIYEEFWEFISDDNPEFKELVIKDKKRRSKSKIPSISYHP